ncbi:RNA-directed DNA polymerase, eukaryota [Tanacetum coccineum]
MTKTPSPKHQLSLPSAPNAPSKTPSTKGTSSSSIDYTLKSPTSSTPPSTNGYLNSPTSHPPRVPPPTPIQESGSMDITLTLSPITPLPSPPLFGHPIPWNLLEAHGDSCFLINRWDGETIVLGDFNAVRTKDERFGSVFNSTCARNFNQFISSSGLIDVKMDGYSFTWSLPSASKMNGIFLLEDLEAFGFGPSGCCLDSWHYFLFYSLLSCQASPTKEFPIACGLQTKEILWLLCFLFWIWSHFTCSLSRAACSWGSLCFRPFAWSTVIQKVQSRLSMWKANTLSVGGRLTLLKFVLGVVPLFTMSIYKVPMGVLQDLERFRSYQDQVLGWILDFGYGFVRPFSCIFALETVKEISVADKMEASSLCASFRRPIRDGVERQQWMDILHVIDSVTLSSSSDRWSCDLNGEGTFRVKDIRLVLDDIYLPALSVETRWVRYVPIKVNVFAWRARLDRLPTRLNLSKRGILTNSIACPICDSAQEDVHHLFFGCTMAKDLSSLICRWWLDWNPPYGQQWFLFQSGCLDFFQTRLCSKHKIFIGGCFFLQRGGSIWTFRYRLLLMLFLQGFKVFVRDICLCSFIAALIVVCVPVLS